MRQAVYFFMIYQLVIKTLIFIIAHRPHIQQARRQRGSRGGNAPRFSFLPPRLFSCPPGYFFGRKKLMFFGRKKVKTCDFGQKKPRISAKTFFFWRSPVFGRKICDFGQKKPSDFGEDLFFWRSFGFRRKPLPPDLNFAPPISGGSRKFWWGGF